MLRGIFKKDNRMADTKDKLLTADEVQNDFFRMHGHRFKFCICNYTPRRWAECDIFTATMAGYKHEYEIKRSASDFYADKRKTIYRASTKQNPFVDIVSKHKALAAGDVAGPSYFWYIMPEGMVRLKNIPEWAGVLTEHQKIVRKAPKLHKQKITSKEIDLCLRGFYWRFWNEREIRIDFETRMKAECAKGLKK